MRSFVGIDPDGAVALAAAFDAQADVADRVWSDVAGALLLSALDGGDVLVRLRELAEGDRSLGRELRARAQVAERFRLDLAGVGVASPYGPPLLGSASGPSSSPVVAALLGLDALTAQIAAWGGSDHDQRLDRLVRDRIELAAGLAGGDRDLGVRLVARLDQGLAADLALAVLIDETLDARIETLIVEQGVGRDEATRLVEMTFLVESRVADLLSIGSNETAARYQAEFEYTVAALADEQGWSLRFTGSVVATAYADAGRPVPAGIEPFDPRDALAMFHDDLDVALAVSRGEHDEVDGFVSMRDINAAADPANEHLFPPELVVTARAIEQLAETDGNFADQFFSGGVFGLGGEMDQHRDEIARFAAVAVTGLVILGTGGVGGVLLTLAAGAALGGVTAAGTTGLINLFSDTYDLDDGVLGNSVSGAILGAGAAGLLETGTLMLAGRATGQGVTLTQTLGLASESTGLVAAGGVDVVVPWQVEETMHSATGIVSMATGFGALGRAVHSYWDPSVLTALRSGRVSPGDVAEAIGVVYRLRRDAIDTRMGTYRDLSCAVFGNGGDLAGLRYQIKGPGSLLRKIVTEIPQGPAAIVGGDINDVLRYTAIDGPDAMVDLYFATVQSLEDQGYTMYVVKNTWPDNGPYRGVNTFIKDVNGDVFELQFHTPDSFAMKIRTHPLHEQARLLEDGDPIRRRLNDQMIQMSNTLTVPAHIELIEKFDLRVTP